MYSEENKNLLFKPFLSGRDTYGYPDDVFEIPVLVLKYYPLRGDIIDISVTGDVNAPLSTMQPYVNTLTELLVTTREIGSIFRGYSNPEALPSLRYKIVETLEYHEPVPLIQDNPTYPSNMTDYYQMMKKVDIQKWVMEHGVKEVWIWGYNGKNAIWTSNMSSRYGDISNSDRNLYDLPLLDKSYVVYHYNYQRGPFEALLDYGYQIDIMLKTIDHDFYVNRFTGTPPHNLRCGLPSFSLNAERAWDYTNMKYVWSDIEDWQPEGIGKQKRINALTWRNDALSWLIYWMQSIPGRNNGLKFQNKPLTNWWQFVANFEDSITNGVGLYE